MSRITPVDPQEAEPAAQALFEQDIKTHGFPLKTTQVSALVPDIATAARALGRAVAGGGGIPDELRLLMNVRVASLVGCPF